MGMRDSGSGIGSGDEPEGIRTFLLMEANSGELGNWSGMKGQEKRRIQNAAEV